MFKRPQEKQGLDPQIYSHSSTKIPIQNVSHHNRTLRHPKSQKSLQWINCPYILMSGKTGKGPPRGDIWCIGAVFVASSAMHQWYNHCDPQPSGTTICQSGMTCTVIKIVIIIIVSRLSNADPSHIMLDDGCMLCCQECGHMVASEWRWPPWTYRAYMMFLPGGRGSKID